VLGLLEWKCVLVKMLFSPPNKRGINGKENLRQLPPNRTPTPPNPRLLRGIVLIVRDEVLEVILQCLSIRLLDSLQNFHDDGREAVGVEVDFLVVGDLAEIANERHVSHSVVLAACVDVL
jgi:hypothetical protein